MKVKIDEEECIGCGACTAVAEEYFELVDGKAKTKTDDVPEDIVDEILDTCPVGAIKKEE